MREKAWWPDMEEQEEKFFLSMSVGWLHHYLLSTTAGLLKNIARKEKPFVWGEEHFIKGTVRRIRACAASWFLFRRTFFQDWLLMKKSSSVDPETPEKAIISVFKSYLVHILYFCASVSRKFEVIEEKCTKPCSLLSVFPQRIKCGV